jgi:hypothetical protein
MGSLAVSKDWMGGTSDEIGGLRCEEYESVAAALQRRELVEEERPYVDITDISTCELKSR